ncbi:DUF2797 domain-containing protein [Candidatus Saccharibacteria bacterium]|nr:DUF2797 domain-containing protein [Candidatus Saccharibacteria bacterium]
MTQTIIVSHAGYRNDMPTFDTFEGNTAVEHRIEPTPISLQFDTSKRYCVGWFDLASGESHACPDSVIVDPKYNQCPACQRRTGFNPAFYHANSVSEQQEQRNREPHYLYLAYFAPGAVKVGISYSGRNHSRLLEQGARAAFVLDTFPTALLARQYEAAISALDGIVEHLTARKKRELWSHEYSASEARATLEASLKIINETLDTTFEPEFFDLNPQYFFDTQPDLRAVTNRNDDAMISGTVVGCIGTELIVDNNDHILSLNLKHFLGYPVEISNSVIPIDLPPAQASLF